MGTLSNSEDPDEMQHNAEFHQGLHCLLLMIKQPSEWERTGSVVECLTGYRGATGASLTALCP